MMVTNKLLAKMIKLAVNSHDGQFGKDGLPYIIHPLHLMAQFHTNDMKLLAVLHDVVEDTSVTFDDLEREGVPMSLLYSLRLITHIKSEKTYDEYKEEMN